MSMSYLPLKDRRVTQALARLRGGGNEAAEGAQLRSVLRRMVIVGLLVMTADWGTKALMLQVARGSTIPHYTTPNPLALLLVLAIAPIILRIVNTRMMMVALGVCIGGCAGNLFERMAGVPVTDFIPLPHLLASPTCQVGHSCVLMCNLADLALWGSVPLLALAFAWHVIDTRIGPARQATV